MKIGIIAMKKIEAAVVPTLLTGEQIADIQRYGASSRTYQSVAPLIAGSEIAEDLKHQKGDVEYALLLLRRAGYAV